MLLDTLARPRIAPAAVALVCLIALAAALTAEYAFGLRPCVLCVYQRVPYAVALGLGLLGLILLRPAVLQPLLVLAAGLAFLAGPPNCALPGFDTNLSLAELHRQLDEAPDFVACDEVPWALFGISMAGYNLAASLILAAVFLLTAARLRRPKAA